MGKGGGKSQGGGGCPGATAAGHSCSADRVLPSVKEK